jgi:hypothetical protein
MNSTRGDDHHLNFFILRNLSVNTDRKMIRLISKVVMPNLDDYCISELSEIVAATKYFF